MTYIMTVLYDVITGLFFVTSCVSKFIFLKSANICTMSCHLTEFPRETERQSEKERETERERETE